MKIALTDREADVMQVLWNQGPSVVNDVQKHLSDRLAYTTVLTVLRTLEAKGYVGTRRRDGSTVTLPPFTSRPPKRVR